MSKKNTFIAEFEAASVTWCKSRSLRPNTERSYLLELNRLRDWAVICLKAHSIEDLARFDMTVFLKWMHQQYLIKHLGLHPCQSSQQQTRRIIESFMKDWAMRSQIPNRKAWFVPVQKITEIMGNVDSARNRNENFVEIFANKNKLFEHPSKEPLELRNKLMAHLAFWCCATTSEIMKLRVMDVSPKYDQISISGKDAQVRLVLVPPHMQILLKKYLFHTVAKEERQKNQTSLFAGHTKSALSAGGIRKAVKCVFEKNAVASLPPRDLRRAFIELVVAKENSIEHLAYRAGKKTIIVKSSGRDIQRKKINDVEVMLRHESPLHLNATP
jgi:site-specific recombinase XerD